jgi:hypothetical protein
MENWLNPLLISITTLVNGARGGVVVEALRSIPGGVTGFFHWHNPSGRTMVLGSTQPQTEKRTRDISWG